MSSFGQEKRTLVLYSSGIFLTYFFYGIVQEKITHSKYGPKEEKFSYTLSMIFLQCIVNAIFSKIALIMSGGDSSTIPTSKFMLCSFSYIGAMFMSNYSLQHVNYPTQVVGKSIKPIPVMILGVLWAKKKYPLRKWLFVIIITVGLLLFMYKETKKSNMHHAFGIGELCLVISLALDGLTGGVQEEIRSKYSASSYALMYNVNKWSMVYLISAIFITKEWAYFIPFAIRHPEVLVYILLFGVTSAIGQMFIFTTIIRFGPLMLSIVTTSRKFFTVLASVLLFNHPMSSRQWLGAVLVFIGLICDQIWGKDSRKHGHTTRSQYKHDRTSGDNFTSNFDDKHCNGDKKSE